VQSMDQTRGMVFFMLLVCNLITVEITYLDWKCLVLSVVTTPVLSG